MRRRAAILLLAFAASCESRLEIKVERIAFPPPPIEGPAEDASRSERRQANEIERMRRAYADALDRLATRRGPSVFGSIVRMTAIRAWTHVAADAVENALLDYVNSQPDQADPMSKDSEDWAETFRLNYASFHRDCARLRAIGDRAHELLQAERYDRLFLAESETVALRATHAARQIEYFAAESEEKRIEAFEDRVGADLENARKFVANLTSEKEALAPILAAGQREAPTSAGFGGFMMPDVFVLQPSDPLYEFVLNAPVDSTPLSATTVETVGDSSVVIVQESPGQFRIKRVASDPTTMIQNSAFVADMALRAAAQTLAPTP